MSDDEIVCHYPDWMEERMREHRQMYGFNPGQGETITVPHRLWVRLGAMSRRLETRYRSGYMAGYYAKRRKGNDSIPRLLQDGRAPIPDSQGDHQ